MTPAKLILGALGMSASMAVAMPAQAIVYCTHICVPVGCTARHGVVLRPAPHVAAPAVVAAPVIVATPGVGAPGVGVAPGVGAQGVNTPANSGGPVNRVGRR